MGAVVASCSLGTEPTFQENDLLGLWQEDGKEAFVRFTAEKDSTGVYKFGYEWDEGDGVFESDRTNIDSKYGNGWFKWKLVKADLTEIHLMENGGAEMRTCTSFAPASLSILTILPQVVPRTMESSTMMIRFPATDSFNTFNFT